MKVRKLERFIKWYNKLDLTQKTEVDVRLTRIVLDSYFGKLRKLGSIYELKLMKSGLRVYYAKHGNELVLLLSGGNKNNKSEQSRDIKQAQEIYEEYESDK